MKKFLFHAIGISMSLISAFLAAEVILRVRDEAGVEGAWNSLFEQQVPTTSGTETSEIVADPILGFKYNPEHPEGNSQGIREKQIPLENQPGKPRIIVIGDSVSVMCDGEWNPRKGYVPFLGQDLDGRAEVGAGAQGLVSNPLGILTIALPPERATMIDLAETRGEVHPFDLDALLLEDSRGQGAVEPSGQQPESLDPAPRSRAPAQPSVVFLSATHHAPSPSSACPRYSCPWDRQ